MRPHGVGVHAPGFDDLLRLGDTEKPVRGVNDFCRSTTTISAGEGLAKERRWRPQRNSVIVHRPVAGHV
jgi:hypothetical protein